MRKLALINLMHTWNDPHVEIILSKTAQKLMICQRDLLNVEGQSGLLRRMKYNTMC